MKPKQFFFVVLGILVAVVAAGGVGYYYAYQYMGSKSAELSTRLAEQIEADEQLDTLDRLQMQYDRDVEPILPLIDATLPHDKKQSEILAQVQRIAQSSGMMIDGVVIPNPGGLPSGVSQTIKAGKVSAMPINFKVKGNYAQLQTFTQRLENLNRFTNITTLNVKRDGAGVATWAFTMNAYVKP
jgi:Tfp pilus assembly protein PilO